MTTRKNCWEFKKCGREPDGAKVMELGVCPAAIARGLDGVHSGMNAGRACWVVAGTFCRGEVQGIFALKQGNCVKCEFYKLVKSEEHPRFTTAASLSRKLKRL